MMMVDTSDRYDAWRYDALRDFEPLHMDTGGQGDRVRPSTINAKMVVRRSNLVAVSTVRSDGWRSMRACQDAPKSYGSLPGIDCHGSEVTEERDSNPSTMSPPSPPSPPSPKSPAQIPMEQRSFEDRERPRYSKPVAQEPMTGVDESQTIEPQESFMSERRGSRMQWNRGQRPASLQIPRSGTESRSFSKAAPSPGRTTSMRLKLSNFVAKLSPRTRTNSQQHTF